MSFLNINTLKHNPPILPDQWCEKQHCMQWGDWVISQPSSSVLVYLLAGITLWIAYLFLKNNHGQASKWWWGISLLLGGIGAFLAGTSFQAFGYMIKCSGNTVCNLTSWWEIAYNIFTVWGGGALLIAISHSSMTSKGQKWSRIYALTSSVLYTIICLIGTYLPNAFMVSFEMMILFTLPAYLYIIALHLYQYLKNRDKQLLKYLSCWAILALTLVAYAVYLSNHFTEKLWSQGVWFSENDVLHIFMITWCFYIYFFLLDDVRDAVIMD